MIHHSLTEGVYVLLIKRERMKTNIGSNDKLIRIAIALTIAGLYSFSVISGVMAAVSMVIAGILVVTVLAGVCPLYLPFGINTAKRESRRNHKPVRR
jgi:predicted metal-binding membrane protein